LTDEHNNLPVVVNATILELVARTVNFTPTHSANQIVFNVRKSMNLVYSRVYKNFSKSIHRKLIEKGAEEARSAGLSSWQPRVFQHSDAMLKQQRNFRYSEANTTWRNNQG
jgi:hypothetical protein